MSVSTQPELKLNHTFQLKTKRHFLNGHISVIHCHHYTALYTQLAIDAKETQLLVEVSEDTFYEMLRDYFTAHEILTSKDKIELACQYYQAIGLGLLRVNYFGQESAECELLTSHVDQAWLQKWNKYDAPVNYITAGYIAALCAVASNESPRTFYVTEQQSIVMGAETSLFNAVRR